MKRGEEFHVDKRKEINLSVSRKCYPTRSKNIVNLVAQTIETLYTRHANAPKGFMPTTAVQNEDQEYCTEIREQRRVAAAGAAVARSVASARGARGRVREWGSGGRRALRLVAAAEARAQQRARARRRRSTNGARCFADYRRGATTPRHGQRHDRHYQARVSLW